MVANHEKKQSFYLKYPISITGQEWLATSFLPVITFWAFAMNIKKVIHIVDYYIGQAKRKLRPVKKVDHKWLMEHPEFLTVSIKHLFKDFQHEKSIS